MWITRACVIAASTAVLATTIAVGPASAHAALAGSNPADGAQIEAAPEEVVLTFNQDVQPMFATLNVVGADGTQWGRSEPVVNGRDLSVRLDGLGDAGQYTVAFRVTSADGHPITGSYDFTLTTATPTSTSAAPSPAESSPGGPAASAASESTGAAPTTAAADTAASNSSEVGGIPAWVIAGGIVIVLAAGVAFMLRTRPTK